MNQAKLYGENMPTDYINQYRQQGFCVLEGLIPPALMKAAWQRVQEIIDHPPDWPRERFQVLKPSGILFGFRASIGPRHSTT